MRVYPFNLAPRAGSAFARFPFMFAGSPWSSPDADGRAISCALSLRSAGDQGFDAEGRSPARPGLFASLGIESDRVAARRQTHSRDVLAVDPLSPPPRFSDAPPGDGLASSDGSVFLSVTVADCLPVYLLDTVSGAFAVLHSGWKGTGIAAEALSLMRERWGTRAASVAAVLGPCIRGCCYEVDAQRASAFDAEFGGPGESPLGPVVREFEGRFFIDLQAANARLLAAAGVEHLAVCQDCTFEDERLGSYRREGPGRFTRMVAVVGRFPVGD